MVQFGAFIYALFLVFGLQKISTKQIHPRIKIRVKFGWVKHFDKFWTNFAKEKFPHLNEPRKIAMKRWLMVFQLCFYGWIECELVNNADLAIMFNVHSRLSCFECIVFVIHLLFCILAQLKWTFRRLQVTNDVK